ncbi:hypothetical protein STRCR_1595 [Streptococcus criceti HS-6]|uniref:Transposase IS4-like domain-containing protein n=1 Tax=Streptococcus criceti HS-6 TaxID=873449 RepID=G5JPE3_STRCG|nr:hypothetical protein STRCR_1595 [Streptococcus criceti HS-6]
MIMDRGYESHNLMAHCQEKNWFYIMRIKDGKMGIKSGLDLPQSSSFDVDCRLKLCRKQTKEWKTYYKDYPNQYRYIPYSATFDFLPAKNRKKNPAQVYELAFRVVRLKISSGHYETLLTNTDYPPDQLKKLYASRWGIETSFRDLKYSIGLVNFHAKKKEGILQELLARVINYNFCQWLVSAIPIKPSRGQYSYKICFSDAAYGCRQFFRGILSSFQLEAFLRRHVSVIRPNRSFDRRLRAQSSVSFTYRVP